MKVLRERVNKSNAQSQQTTDLVAEPLALVPPSSRARKTHVLSFLILATVCFAIGTLVALIPGGIPALSSSGPRGFNPNNSAEPRFNEREQQVLAIKYIHQGDLTKARSVLEEVLKRNPKSAVARANLGRTFAMEGSYSIALEHLTAAVNDGGHEPEIWNNLGYVQMQIFDWPAAEQSFLKAIELNPEYPVPLLYIARLYEFQNDWTAALKYYKRYLEVLPQDTQDKTKVRERIRVVSSLALHHSMSKEGP